MSKRIEEKHINPLLDSVNSAIGAMESMGEAVNRSKNECS